MRRAVLPVTVGLTALAGAGAVVRHRTISRWKATPDPLGGRPPRFPPAQAHTVRVDDGADIYTLRGGSGPTIVLVHGLTSNHDDWGPVAHQLIDEGFEVIAVDQRGHGGSTVGRDGFGVERQAADLAQALVALDVSDAVLVGHSMGGMAAMGLAIHDPEVLADRVSGMALVATAATLPSGDSRLRAGSTGVATYLGRHPEWFRLMVGYSVLGAEPSMALVDAGLASYRRCPEATRRGASLGLVGLDLLDRLRDLGADTIVICGDSDRLTPLRLSEAIVAALPGSRLEIIAGAGHMVIWEAVDQLSRLIVDFAAGVQSERRSVSDSGT